jgi:hypothetical protein
LSGRDEGEVFRITSLSVRQPNDCCPRKRHVWGTKAKPPGVGRADGFAVCEAAFLCCASHSVASNSGPFAERLTRPFLQLAAEKLDALRDACPKPGIVWGNFESSRDPSRASFYLARFASSQSNQCKIRKTKLAINAMAVTPATESTNACAAVW